MRQLVAVCMALLCAVRFYIPALTPSLSPLRNCLLSPASATSAA